MTSKPGRMRELAAIYAEHGTLLPLLKEQMLLDMDRIPDGRRADVIHASELSHPGLCHRAVAHRILRNEKPRDPFVFQKQNVFDEGHSIHRKWQDRMRRTGRLWGQWKCRICRETRLGLEPPATACTGTAHHLWAYDEVPLYLAGRMLAGHADGAADGKVVEIKSIGIGTLRYENPRLLAEHTHTVRGRQLTDLDGIWDAIRRPFASHVRQGNMYAWMMQQLGYPFSGSIVFLYECKWNQAAREFIVSPSPALVQEMLATAGIIAAAVRAGQLPDCPGGGCTQCEDTHETAGTPHHAPDRAGQQQRRTPARRTGDRDPVRRMGTPARRQPPADPPRRAPAHRRRADGALPPGQRLAEIPEDTGGDGRDR